MLGLRPLGLLGLLLGLMLLKLPLGVSERSGLGGWKKCFVNQS